ncbi:MAG TPA: DUF2442 domain-containing protein [Chloroflexota bacterium]|nr:DUF2442 domain-containing protein [Chloroflexota bacterium]
MRTSVQGAKANIAPAIEEARAISVSVDDDYLRVTLQDGRLLSVPLVWFPTLASADPEQRSRWELIGPGVGIHWPDIDEDLCIATMLGDHE